MFFILIQCITAKEPSAQERWKIVFFFTIQSVGYFYCFVKYLCYIIYYYYEQKIFTIEKILCEYIRA